MAAGDGSVPMGSSPRRSLKQQLSQHTTPYQALPVQGPFVREHTQTPSYPVLEPDEVGRFLPHAPAAQVAQDSSAAQAVSAARAAPALHGVHSLRQVQAVPQNREERVRQVIEEYKRILTGRTALHMGCGHGPCGVCGGPPVRCVR